jgi:hypothetical protein
MPTIRRSVILVLVATLGTVAACSSGSGGTTAASACADGCNKQEACGDIDSVTAAQCTTKCSADAQVLDAAASMCLNESDILAATEQCLSRACTDYASCLTTLPACLTGGGTTTTKGTGGTGTGGTGTGGNTTGTTITVPTGTGCAETMDGVSLCEVLTSTETMCPTGATQVSSCPKANLLGSCTITSGGAMDVIYFYSTGGSTASAAQTACTELGNGTWTPA